MLMTRMSKRLQKNMLLATSLMMLFSNFSGCASLQSQPDRERGIAGILGLRRQNGRAGQDIIDNVDPLGRRSFNRLLLDDLSPGNISTTVAVRTTFEEDRPAAENAYTEGKQLYKKAIEVKETNPDGTDHFDLFLEAANKFRLAAGKFPDSQLEHDALYFEGESYFFSNHYVQANRAYENLISRYSGSRYLDNAEARRFHIAEYWLALSESGSKIKIGDPSRPSRGLAAEARRIFHRIRLDDPTGKLADDATLALANAYFKSEKWLDAADTYEDLRRNYPGSQHQYHAHLFELKSRLNSYQGSSYDETPLVKADQLMKQLVKQFPDKARQEEEFLSKEAGMIQHLLAERDWGMAQYFEQQGENRAAQFYYQQVAENHAHTRFGDEVQSELTRVAELPGKPKQHAKWLIDMFPEHDKTKPVIASNPSTIVR